GDLSLRYERIDLARLLEASGTKHATVTSTAGSPIWVRRVTAVRQTVVESKGHPPRDDPSFGEIDERGVHCERRTLDTSTRRHPGERLERPNELRAAVRIARVVESVHTD